ncbi:MAG: hypothetical protein IEMM0008_1450 [bacterium]|nr:MAG: hypothetical protein IEMM0008_1450 [bacterium]
MDDYNIAISLVSGFILGSLIIWLILRAKIALQKQEINTLKETENKLNEKVTGLEKKVNELATNNTKLDVQLLRQF